MNDVLMRRSGAMLQSKRMANSGQMNEPSGPFTALAAKR